MTDSIDDIQRDLAILRYRVAEFAADVADGHVQITRCMDALHFRLENVASPTATPARSAEVGTCLICRQQVRIQRPRGADNPDLRILAPHRPSSMATVSCAGSLGTPIERMGKGGQ